MSRLSIECVGRVDVGGSVTARYIIIATGSVPFVPPGIPIDGKTVSTLTPMFSLLLTYGPRKIALQYTEGSSLHVLLTNIRLTHAAFDMDLTESSGVRCSPATMH